MKNLARQAPPKHSTATREPEKEQGEATGGGGGG